MRATAERVTEKGSWLSADLVSDRDLTLIRGLRLYELSDIMYTTEVQYRTTIITRYRRLLFTIRTITFEQRHTTIEFIVKLIF